MSEPTWHLLGAGAMGCLFASMLTRAGISTTLLLRERPADGSGLVHVEEQGQRHSYPVALEYCAENAPIGRLLVVTKAYDIRRAIAAVRHRLGEESQILLLANGMGFVEELRADKMDLPLFSGTTTQGAFRIDVRHIRHAGHGVTHIGRHGDSGNETFPPAWYQSWAHAVSPCQWETQIDRALWLKLAINCAINPLTALHRCPNGSLASHAELRGQVTSLCDEAALVSRALGYHDIADTLHDNVSAVITATAANRSSMLQDIEAGRRTEIDYINGYLLEVARDLGVKTPMNEQLMDRIHKLGH